jgi:enoyl-CoA hydratase
MDLILTGRGVSGTEGFTMGLVNRVTEPGEALKEAIALGHQLADFPQTCMRHDRLSAIEQWDLSEPQAMLNEVRHALVTIGSGETLEGAARFTSGVGRHGEFHQD